MPVMERRRLVPPLTHPPLQYFSCRKISHTQWNMVPFSGMIGIARQHETTGYPMWYGQVEGTDIVVLDPRFKACFAGHVRVERLWTGARWAEGPAWFAAGRYLVWSDIPNNRMMRFVEPSGDVSVFREPSNNSNGNTVDNQGRLVTCEHLTRRVTRTEIDGSISVIAEKWNGRLCLSQIKSGHTGDAIRRGLGGKEYALPS
jgi:hypothetical protein